MRIYALGLIILTDIIIGLTRDMDVNSSGLNFLLTLIIVVIVAFAASALLRNAKNIKMTRNYSISGILGIVVGIIFFFWIRANTEALLEWFRNHGLTILLLLNVIAGLTIFFSKPSKKAENQLAE